MTEFAQPSKKSCVIRGNSNAFFVVGTAELYTAVGIEHRVDVDAVAVVVVVVVAKGAVAVDVVIAVLVGKKLDTVWNGESLKETFSVRSGSFRAVISIGEQGRDRLHSAGARSLTAWMIWHSRASDTTVKYALFRCEESRRSSWTFCH